VTKELGSYGSGLSFVDCWSVCFVWNTSKCLVAIY